MPSKQQLDFPIPPGTPAEIAKAIIDQIWHDPRRFKTWLTPKDAAAYLSLKIRGLEDMRARGAGPKFCKVNERVVRYHIDDLDAWLRSNGNQHD